MLQKKRLYYLIPILIGIAGLLVKRWYPPWFPDYLYDHTGNVAVSFSVYFLARIAGNGKINPAVSAGAALLLVELFELTNGFWVMLNVYDPLDYLANALGVGLALVVDLAYMVPLLEPAEPE